MPPLKSQGPYSPEDSKQSPYSLFSYSQDSPENIVTRVFSLPQIIVASMVSAIIIGIGIYIIILNAFNSYLPIH